MTDKKTEALKLALEALEGVIYRIERDLEHDHEWAVVERELASEAITALREALAEQPAQQGYWQEEARRYAQNAEFWRGKYEAATAQHQCMEHGECFGGECIYSAPQPAQPKGCQCPACKIAPHASDCPVHNEPAWPNGPCDCGAQPEQEPVAEITAEDMGRPFNAIRIGTHFYKEVPPVGTKLYTSPPASKPWVGLTEEERKEIYRQAVYVDGAIRMTEAKLKEKNA